VCPHVSGAVPAWELQRQISLQVGWHEEGSMGVCVGRNEVTGAVGSSIRRRDQDRQNDPAGVMRSDPSLNPSPIVLGNRNFHLAGVKVLKSFM
jgi:hypothetical protein